jgi:hypothetical protein
VKPVKQLNTKKDYGDILRATTDLMENGERFLKRTADASGTSIRLMRASTQRMLLRLRKEQRIVKLLWERADKKERPTKKRR